MAAGTDAFSLIGESVVDRQDRKNRGTGFSFAIAGSLAGTRLPGIAVVPGGCGWAGNGVLEIILAIFLVCLFAGAKQETGGKLLVLGVTVGFIEPWTYNMIIHKGAQ